MATASSKNPPPYNEEDSFFVEEEDEPLDSKIIDQVRKAIWEKNKYEFIETNTRNVLLCGRSRSGKTTAVSVLKDPCYTPKKNSIFADTVNANFQTFSINDRAQHSVQKFTLNIVDTPGLFEVTSKDKTARTDQVLLQTIAKCLENEITYMNAIIMFATFEAGIHPQDIEAMKMFLAMFGGTSGCKIALCITHADIHSKDWRKDLEQQLMEHAELSRLITEEKMEILFMGCTDSRNSHIDSEKKLKQSYINTYKMRETMLQFIFGAEKRTPLKEMKIATAKIAQVKGMLEDAIRNMKYFLGATDHAQQQFQQTLVLHRETMQYIVDNQAYVNVAELSQLLADLTIAAREINASKTLPDDLKAQIIWPLRI